ncbi:5-oxoprolinase subunit B family protein [Dietzia aurantiaca]|uniref:Allophanate hydrolase subunit 1 n=1 Tax=Dietzia aurantiaca TaxID=983873 RepID=A0ABV9PNY6_9ACTN
MTTTRIRPCGEAALLLECADLAAAVGWAEEIGAARLGAVDVVAAARTVLVTARGAADLPRLRRALEALLAAGRTARSEPGTEAGSGAGAGTGAGDAAGTVTLDVRYDGPDLADVAELAGVSVEAFVRMHTSITWRAAFGGFAPGFFYLVDARELGADELDASADPGRVPMPTVPRLDSPRPKVPAGSVAVADRFCAVYPGASPGGWRLLGTTDAGLWDIDRPQPALLAPGTLVRFREVSADGAGSAGSVGSAGGAR